MSMRKQLEDEISTMLMKYISSEALEETRMNLTMILDKYSIDKQERSLAVYNADETQLVMKKWLAAKIAKGCSVNTIRLYRNTVRKILAVINKPYNEITADDIRFYLAMRVQKDKTSKVNANNERRCLSSFYQWLQSEEILLKNPMNKVDNIKVNKKKKHAFNKMELEQIRAACRCARETAMIEVLISTWARASEVCQIKISEIEGDSIVVHGKGDKDRTVYLTPRAQIAVNQYLSERKDSNPYLFPKSSTSGHIGAFTKGRKRKMESCWYQDPKMVSDSEHMDKSTLEENTRRIGKRAGVQNCHPHRFRRTGATMALRSGMPLLKVSKLLGHEQINTTQIYLDISDEELMQAHQAYVN